MHRRFPFIAATLISLATLVALAVAGSADFIGPGI